VRISFTKNEFAGNLALQTGISFCNSSRYVTEESKGFIIGDKIIVTSGPLKGRESIIRKIDRHKRRAEIEVAFLGDIRRINVALEVISKVL
jgi:transcriptional antiterminator NusG